MAACWSCGAEAGAGPFCGACGRIQPGRAGDPFERLGVERRQHLDAAQLESRYRDLSRRLHPDKFSRADARERRFSVEQSALLNEALRTLRDPVRRAELLLRQEGFETAGEDKPGASKALPMEFYEEMLEDREALLEAKEQGPDAVRRLDEKIRARQAETFAVIDRAFVAWEQGGGRDALAPAAAELGKLRYYARFLDEVEGRGPEL